MEEGRMRLNLHNHSHYSADAITRPQTMLKIAKQNNLVVAITDHGSAAAWPEFRKYSRELKVPFIQGTEFMTFDENDKKTGEILGLFLNEPIKKCSAAELLDQIRAQDALAAVPHPFDPLRHNFKFLNEFLPKIDLIEGFNSRCKFQRFNQEAKAFAAKHQLPMLANADAHTPEEITNAYTEINALDLEEAHKALLSSPRTFLEKKAPFWAHIQTQLAKQRWIGPR
ncbi:MAG: PHP domain-containing protein [Candidatus Diapherotrites archaeon]|nr:PHP domain-containing protein [Candidatus Diapherotrites archaeon]